MRTTAGFSQGIEITAPLSQPYSRILTPRALDFLVSLQRRFGETRKDLLEQRRARQTRLDAGELPDFLPETESIRNGDWSISPIPSDLLDRRVEITGPVDRKMIINALNSGAHVFMADFEDSHTPTWSNNLDGQINLRDAVSRTIHHVGADGRSYSLKNRTATLMVRPRGWHLVEKHLLIDGKPASASLFDFGLYFFHNARALIDRKSGPYFYLPKLESHLEARLWNDVFVHAQNDLGIPQGTIKATVLIETILAAFEMDEILYELRTHSAGLNCGRWDYLFSCIKKFRNRPDFMLADRKLLTMTTRFMRSYSLLTIKTCHQRGAHAIGGMAAQIPIKDDAGANAEALAKVRADKKREAHDGHDGTWVAHPDLVPIALAEFDAAMPTPNQIHIARDDVVASAPDLLAFLPDAPITEQGLRTNIDVVIQYLGSWLTGRGCVPIHHLMEDAATAEISRSQIWLWIHSPRGVLDDGRKASVEILRQLLPQVLQKVRQSLGEQQYIRGRYELAATILDDTSTRSDFVEFITLLCYDYLD
ncbi:MAG: malate synthase A [Acidiferrobacterales bacterium]